MTIYAISGKAEHGKNYIADKLKNFFESEGERVCILANADYLKFLAKYIGWDGSKTEPMRKLLQEFGTEYVRNTVDDSYWVKQVIEQIKLLEEYFDVFLISDCRFPNEIQELYEAFGYPDNYSDSIVKTIKVVRPNHVSKLTEEQLNHPSETSLDSYDKFDYVVENIDGEEISIVDLMARSVQ